jgi:LPXTG-motif cell wall-anchored protein
MRSVSRLLLASALGVGLVGGGLFASSATAQQGVTLQLMEQNGSGVMGTAMLMPMGNQTMVTVELTNAPGPHPIHFHEGTCANLNPAVKIPLTAVSANRSETTVDASLATIQSMQHSINVHKSPQEASVYVSCGEVPVAAAGAAQPKPGAPAPKPGDPAPKPGMPATKPAPAASPAPAMKPAPAAKPGPAPAQAPRALPRTGEADAMNWAIGGLAAAGVVLLGAGLVARRRGV